MGAPAGEGPSVDGARRGRSGVARAAAPVLGTGVVLGLVPLLLGGSGYLVGLASTALVVAAYGIGFNVIFGGTGQLFLCLGALAGVSSYTSVLLADDHGWPLPASLLAGVLVATALGGLFSWVAVRRHLGVIFVGIVTLAFSLAVTNLAQGLRGLTGGETGRVVATGGPLLREPLAAYYLLLAVVLVFLGAHRWLQRSRLGWAFRALRDDPVAAELAGVDVAGCRILGAMIGSAMLGLAGALSAHHEAFISPATYAFAHVDVRTLIVLGVGGIGSLLGPVVGAVVLGVVDELLRPLGQLRLAVYGAVLIALFLGVRRGLVPTVTSTLTSLAARARTSPARTPRE